MAGFESSSVTPVPTSTKPLKVELFESKSTCFFKDMSSSIRETKTSLLSFLALITLFSSNFNASVEKPAENLTKKL